MATAQATATATSTPMITMRASSASAPCFLLQDLPNQLIECLSYGHMYQQPWVQAMVKQIQDYLVANAGWLGIDPGKEQRVLDYACGHGTISLGVLKASPKAISRGIDLDASQAERYINEAAKVLGGSEVARMVGIQGDLYHPSEQMARSEWSDFNMVIISMALHHVSNPVEMLRRLKDRLRPGGTLVVVEFLRKEDGADTGGSYVEKDMVEVVAKQKIWPGFTTGNLESDMRKAGFEGFDVRVLEEPAHIPESVRGPNFRGEQWCFFAKATAEV